MRILYFVFDGFNVDNATPLFTNLEEVKSQYEVAEVYNTKHPYIRTRMASRDAWCKMYTKFSPQDWAKKNEFNPEDHGRPLHNSVYNPVNPEEHIWTKLSKRGIPSYLFPFCMFAYVMNSNFLSLEEEGRRHVYADVFPHDVRVSYTVEAGELTRRTDRPALPCWSRSFNHTSPSMANSNPYFKEVAELWNDKSRHAEEMPKWWRWLKDNVLPSVYKDAEESKMIYDTIVYPRLEEFSKLDDTLIHLSIAESDGFFHFMDNFPEEQQFLRTSFFDVLLKEVIDLCKADVVIISGDHGMVDQFPQTAGNRKGARTEFDVDGLHITSIKSNRSVALLKMDHTTTQGAIILTDEKHRYFADDVSKFMERKENILIGDAIYDAILEHIDKE